MEPTRSRSLRVDDIDLPNTLQPIGIYGVDPTHRSAPGAFAKVVLTPDGPGTMRLTWNTSGDVTADAWGPGAEWVLDTAERWVGLADDLTGFDPNLHPRVARWWRDHGTFRLSSLGVVWQELVLVLLGQRVTTEEAAKSWNRMCRTWGQPAPGPCELWAPPTPDVIAGLNYRELHRMNVERRRADAILLAARRAARLEEAATMPPDAALERLSALPGFGPWTATSTLISTHGDPDVIMLRDYGMPTMVNYAFTGDATRLPPDEGGDDVMCAHLEPWRGHRQRIVRLLFAAKVAAPRRAPRAFNPDIRRF
ncbi:MAG: DNA-3-methyladenine glycosylase 2 family protein [Actinomycetota bacterium]